LQASHGVPMTMAILGVLTALSLVALAEACRRMSPRFSLW
jgi:hypothetical protein